MSSSTVSVLTSAVLLGALVGNTSIARADAPPTQPAPAPENLRGHRGLMHVMAATTQPKGTVSLGTNFQFFTAGGFLPAAGGDKADHSRLVNTYNIAWTPLSFLETAFALHVISNNTSTANADELQVTVGDPQLSVKGSYEILSGLAVGGLLDFRYLSGAGFFDASAAAFHFAFGALTSWAVSPRIPLNLHLNLGFVVDASENLFDDPAQQTPAQLFAAQVSSFNRFTARFGVDYLTKYVSPFIEISTEPFVGSGAPSFGDSPTWLSFGAHAWVSEERGLQLLAAADIGLAGVGDGTPSNLAPGKYAFVIPRWNLAIRLSYRFDPLTKAPPPVAAAASEVPLSAPPPKLATISGEVVDNATRKPIWNARIEVAGSRASSLAVDPKDGTFASYDLPVGQHTLVARADGYTEAQAQVDLVEGGATTVIALAPKTTTVPGAIRGTVTARGGRRIRNATFLIPALDRTIAIGKAGTFHIDLKAGQYEIVVSAPRYRTQRKKIRVLEGSTVILNVELYR